MSEAVEFFRAVGAGEVERVRQLVAARADLVTARDPDGATGLHHAAFHGHRRIVELLVANGADINARDGEHDATPAGWAVHYLRELGGLLAIEIEDVRYAIRMGDVAWASRLVTRHPALVDAVDRDGTPLAIHARAAGDAEIAALFARSKHRTAR